MFSKLVICTILLAMAVVEGAVVKNKEIVPMEKESRILEAPVLFIGAELIFKAFKIIGVLLSVVKSVVGFKLAALATALGVAYWVASNLATVGLSIIGVLGFCKLTGKCWSQPEPVLYDFENRMADSARLLQRGIEKYH